MNKDQAAEAITRSFKKNFPPWMGTTAARFEVSEFTDDMEIGKWRPGAADWPTGYMTMLMAVRAAVVDVLDEAGILDK